MNLFITNVSLPGYEFKEINPTKKRAGGVAMYFPPFICLKLLIYLI